MEVKMSKVFIIAECGINANGDIEIAKKLIEGAKFAGADAVKFQKRSIERCYSKEYLDSPRNDNNPYGWKTQREQKQGLEFNKEEYDIINQYCKKIGIEWFASAWDLESVEFLKQYDLKYNKIASPMLTHIELVNEVAKQRKYTFISTGMSTLEEIKQAVDIFRKYNTPFELMHCNSQYPAPNEDLNLMCIPMLKKKFNCPVGYSCHSIDMIIPVYAVALGATSVEKHITLNRAMYGSDQSASIEIEGFRKMIKYIREAEVIMGDGIKRVTKGEEKVKAKLRRNKDY